MDPCKLAVGKIITIWLTLVLSANEWEYDDINPFIVCQKHVYMASELKPHYLGT